MPIAASRNSKFFLSILVAASALLKPATPCFAQFEDFGIADLDNQKGESPRQTQIDEVDTQSGDLLVRHVDLRLKGDGDNDIVIHRNYSMRSKWLAFGRNQYGSFRWSALGPGWKMLVASRWVEAKPWLIVENFYHEISSSIRKLCKGIVFGAEDSASSGGSLNYPVVNV